MTAATSSSHDDSIDQMPLAGLYAQDESFVSPLREYLASYSCTVVPNPSTAIEQTYTIIAGTLEFVKHIYATTTIHALRVLTVIITSEPIDTIEFPQEFQKIVICDPRNLSSQDVDTIFSFFFASDEHVLNITRTIHEPIAPIVPASFDAVIPVVETSPTTSVLLDSDSDRISHMMVDIFGDPVQNKKKSLKKIPRFQILTYIHTSMFYVVFLMGVVLFPILTYIGSLTAATFFVANAAQYLKSSDISATKRALVSSNYWISQSSALLTVLSVPAYVSNAVAPFRGQERYLSLLKDAQLALNEGVTLLSIGTHFASALIPSAVRNDEKLPASTIESLRVSVISVHANLGLAQAELVMLMRDRAFPFSIPYIYRKTDHVLQELQRVRSLLSYAGELLTLYPKIAGFKERQSYLVLLQNANELRPTGGFIGSVGIATFEDGGIADFSIEDVYALDGQLKGHVDPPRPIAELLGSEHWYLRDSNWNPDFLESAKQASWFYEKETGKRIDGVIAVNSSVVVSLLKATGPIQLPDYSDRITSDNFFGKSLHYTQANFFPGSTQKKDFLGSLARAMMTKITTDTDIDGGALLDAIVGGIEQRDIQVHFRIAELQSIVEQYGWAGRVFQSSLCEGVDSRRCLPDPVHISEANLSVSKINYFIKHGAKRDITVSPQGVLNERIVYTIENTVNTAPNPNEKGVGGPYQTYIRFSFPKDAIINTVMLDGVSIPSRKEGTKGLPTIPYIENTVLFPDARSVGVAIRVDPGERKEIQLTYARGIPIPDGQGGGYVDLYWYKHPGISDTPLSTTLRYPLFWITQKEDVSGSHHDGSFIANDGEFEYNTQIQRDTRYRFKFIR